MYTEYYETYPTYTSSEYPSNMTTYSYNQNDGDRLIGGFAGPFILGGITGGLLAPAFYRPSPYYPPYYAPYPPYYRPPFYGRW